MGLGVEDFFFYFFHPGSPQFHFSDENFPEIFHSPKRNSRKNMENCELWIIFYVFIFLYFFCCWTWKMLRLFFISWNISVFFYSGKSPYEVEREKVQKRRHKNVLIFNLRNNKLERNGFYFFEKKVFSGPWNFWGNKFWSRNLT